MTRGGRKDNQTTRERRCIVTRDVTLRDGLLRFVLDASGQVTPDIHEKLPGRGIWVTAKRPILEKAIEKDFFSRAAKRKAQIPAQLCDLVEGLIAEKLIATLSMARKAGLAISGFEKVKDALLDTKAHILFQASDGSKDQKKKLKPPISNEGFYDQLTSQELGLAFGREHVIHAALLAGGMTSSVRLTANRLIGFRADPKNSPETKAGTKGKRV